MKMKKKLRITVLAASLALLLSLAAVASYAYDGTSDPLISLSFLQKFKTEEIDSQIDELTKRIASLEAKIEQLETSGGSAPSVASTEAGYEIVQVEKGTKVLAGGSCDIMLRSGTAVAIAPLATQGLSDYTTGTEILDGQNITINHMMLIPRGDGRGILITSDIAYIMIRGAYALES